jgi:hypothetical protein
VCRNENFDTQTKQLRPASSNTRSGPQPKGRHESVVPFSLSKQNYYFVLGFFHTFFTRLTFLSYILLYYMEETQCQRLFFFFLLWVGTSPFPLRNRRQSPNTPRPLTDARRSRTRKWSMWAPCPKPNNRTPHKGVLFSIYQNKITILF